MMNRGSGNLKSGVVVAASLVLAVAPLPAAPQSMVFDVILRGGTVIDGTGHPRYRADVATLNGRIVRVGDLSGAAAAIDLDVRGLYVTPGFINLHSHASPAALPAAVNMLTQGVTTEILNADGGGATDVAAQLARLPSAGLAVNVGAYIGFNSIWRTVVGADDRRATDDEIERMRAMVLAGLEAGAAGVSAGLDYKPAYYATTDEVVRVAEVARPWRTHFSNHDRVTPESGYSSRVGMEETIAIGERAGLGPLITHMKVQGREQGSASAVTAMMRAATARGNYTSADIYPYVAGQTGLGALLVPAWAQDGGIDAIRKRLADPGLRARIAAEIEEAMDARFNSAQGVYLPGLGRQLVDIMEELKAPAGETVIRLFEGGANLSAILRFGNESDLVELMRYPDAAIACDCGATTSAATHPRNYGAYPRVLGRYVRETGALTWEDAVRKMSGLPASLIGLADRGFITPGMVADVAVFDPETIIDHATYEDPAQYSTGVRHVLVNGLVALRDGAPTGERAGRAIARSFHMPSRPMSTATARAIDEEGVVSIDADGVSRRAAFRLRVDQSADGRRTAGTFAWRDSDAGVDLELAASGLIQTAPGWAAWSGIARDTRTGAQRAVIVIVDRTPAEDRPTIELSTDGGYRVRGALTRVSVPSAPQEAEDRTLLSRDQMVAIINEAQGSIRLVPCR